jgi:hypothetical protein
VRRSLPALVLGLLIASACPVYAATSPLTPAELVVIDREMDGARVEIIGEAIGEDLHADADHRWVNLLGGGTAVGVWLTNTDASRIGRFGDYRATGETLKVTGIVNVACDAHGGEFDVHAEKVERIAPGVPTPHPVEPWKGFVALAGLALAGFEMRLFRRLKDRRPR